MGREADLGTLKIRYSDGGSLSSLQLLQSIKTDTTLMPERAAGQKASGSNCPEPAGSPEPGAPTSPKQQGCPCSSACHPNSTPKPDSAMRRTESLAQEDARPARMGIGLLTDPAPWPLLCSAESSDPSLFSRTSARWRI